MDNLFERLNQYGDSDYYGFHMPGHKRNLNLIRSAVPYKIDITEIEGFDDLHHAHGILKEAQERAAMIYHADETHFLVNGSTVGILSAIAGAVRKGDTVLVARNCHKSVYHALYLNELHPVYIYPEFSEDALMNTEISVKDVQEALKRHPEIKAAVIVSPTYDGVVSDIKAIAACVHEKGIPLIVDEAHGAHFGFDSYFPDNSNTNGADVVIHSLHKTLPALTQTALLHMNGNRINRRKVRDYLHMLQTSSPSYVLMSSMDSCLELLKERRTEIFPPYIEMLSRMRERLKSMKCLTLIETERYDRSRLVVSVKGTDMTGRELYDTLLNDYHLQMEMAAGSYVLAMTSVADVAEGMERLTDALLSIDRQVYNRIRDRRSIESMETNGTGRDIVCYDMIQRLPRQEIIYSSTAMADMAEKEQAESGGSPHIKVVPWSDAQGLISMEYAYLYPPGCPLIVPGEKVSKEAADMLQWYQDHSYTIEGLKEEEHIEVWTDG